MSTFQKALDYNRQIYRYIVSDRDTCHKYLTIINTWKIFFFSFRKLTFIESQLNSLRLHGKITTNLVGFYEHLRKINFSQNIDLLMGDFNIDALDPTSRTLHVMSNCVEVVTESTQISGTLLDHVFVQKDLFKKMNLELLLEH